MNKCYVCEVEIDMDMDKFCVREHGDGSTEYRHLWHGVPGITRAIAVVEGVHGYALTLEDAKKRAEYYINNNPYAAPEVKQGEQMVLDEVTRRLDEVH